MMNIDVFKMNPYDAILGLSFILLNNKIWVDDLNINSFQFLIARNNKTDEEIDLMMRETKVQITLLFMFARIPIPKKFLYKIISDDEYQKIMHEELNNLFPFLK